MSKLLVSAIYNITITTSGPHSLRARSDFYKLTKTKFNEKTINLKQTYENSFLSFSDAKLVCFS